MSTMIRQPPPRRIDATRFLDVPDKPPAHPSSGALPVDDLARFTSALMFAAKAHANQRRKGSSQEPYINHLIEVADLVVRATGGSDVDIALAALLHDTLEDAGSTEGDLAARFGARVASLVRENTDDMMLPKPERKAQRLAKARTKTVGAKLIKLADLISNVRAVDAAPPAGWTRGRRLAYLHDCRDMLDRMAGCHAALEGELRQTLCDAMAGLEGEYQHPVRPLLPKAVGQEVHMLYVGHTGAASSGLLDRQDLADVIRASFPSFTIIEAEAMVDGCFGPVLLIRLRSDSREAIVALAQHLCVKFRQRFVGLEVEGSYLRIYADDTA
jgi:hypothetical protein